MSESTRNLLGEPVGEVCAPNESRPYGHFQRTGDVGMLPVGALLYAITSETLERIEAREKYLERILGENVAFFARLNPGVDYVEGTPVGYTEDEVDRLTQALYELVRWKDLKEKAQAERERSRDEGALARGL